MNDRHLQQIISQTEVGYDDAVAETARVTENRPELNKQKQRIINERLTYIAEHINEYPEVCIQYFVPDKRKIGGKIIEICGNVIKISEADAVCKNAADDPIPLVADSALTSSIKSLRKSSNSISKIKNQGGNINGCFR